jgi:O-succinylbenzoic acid--CoA ligase
MTELSIHAAAREAGDRLAIITRDRAWTFAQCAGLARAPGPVLVAAPTVATILGVYGALEAAQPVAMIHAKAPAAEQLRQRAEIAKAELPTGTAFVLFTSGSTGAARGVVLSRTAILAAAHASAACLGWREDDRWLLSLPMAHAGGLSIVVRCLIARKPLVLLEDDPELPTLVRAARATIASFVPAQLARLVTGDPASLRAVILGGAATPPNLLAAALAAHWPVLGSYGLTETFGQIATARTAGGPLVLLPGVELECRETIAIRTPQLATCYLDGTPIAPQLVTADLGELGLAGGERVLHVLGRRDDVIISGGENVHPLEVEAILSATPGIAAACAFGVPDERYGHVVGVAVIVTASFDRRAALAHWHATLAPYARPRWLAEVATLPLLPSGKLDRLAIATLPSQPLAY